MSIVEALSSIRPSSTFLSLRGYRSESGELADYQLAFHMSYKSALERSIAAVEAHVPADDLEAQAKSEVLASYRASLAKIEAGEEPENDVYDRVLDATGTPIKGIKYHRESGKLHLYGLLVRKATIEPGNRKEVKSRPLTIAKDALRKLGPVSRFRQFIVDPAHVSVVVVEGQTLTPDGE